MDADPYTNRELDAKFDSLHEKLDLVLAQTSYTNGKVRKIVLALVLAFGLIIGMGFEDFRPIVALLLAA